MVIGIDHGYGYIKTRNAVFSAGVAKLNTLPPIKENIVKYGDTYYQVGVTPDGIAGDKTVNEDYYILTLAAIAEEMKARNPTACNANVKLAVGIPLMRYGAEKDDLVNYLRQNEHVLYTYEDKQYNVRINPDMYVYPQGFAAIAAKLNEVKGTSYLVDIGTATTEILPINSEHRIDLKRAYTSQWGTSDCIAMINEEVSREYRTELSTEQIIDIMLNRDVVIPAKIKELSVRKIKDFCAETYALLRQKKVNYDVTQTFIMGGGAGLLNRYADEQPEMVKYITDIKANVIGYELLAKASEKKKGTW